MIFFEKIYVFYKIYIICRKNVFIWKKKFYIEFFFTEKNINENVKIYISHLKIYFYAENVCVTNKI